MFHSRWLTSKSTLVNASLVPFDLIALAIRGGGTDRGVSEAGFNAERLTRIVRLLRLLRVLRVLRATTLVRRWEERVSVPFSLLNIFKNLAFMFCFSHWAACLWAMLAKSQASEDLTWVTKWQVRRMVDGVNANRARALGAACEAQVPPPVWDHHMSGIGVTHDAVTGEAYTRNAAFWGECYYPNEL